MFFWLLLAGSIVIAVVNLIQDQEQRSIRHLVTWVLRVCIGAMWWQQSLWKLPPTYTDHPDGSGGLMQWMKAMTVYASSEVQSDFVKNVVLPHLYFFAPKSNGACADFNSLSGGKREIRRLRSRGKTFQLCVWRA